jgi:hypothetical protein
MDDGGREGVAGYDAVLWDALGMCRIGVAGEPSGGLATRLEGHRPVHFRKQLTLPCIYQGS